MRQRMTPDAFRVDIDLDFAAREAQRVSDMLAALRRRHDLSRYEYTQHVRIVPGGETFSHPVLTLSNRFADDEDLLLSTYLHEQMHWYLWLFGTPDTDPLAPFFDELVRRYPEAPTRLPEGARGYDATYLHLVINWLEIMATSEFIGFERAARVAETPYGYRWIYRTVLKDWNALQDLYTEHGLFPIRTASELRAAKPEGGRRRAAKRPDKAAAPRQGKAIGNSALTPLRLSAGRRRTTAAARPTPAPRARHRLLAHGGKSVN
ncbi:MAG: hypothetical protein AB7K67_12615 [Hyphomicrobiaceae bacterium]